MSYKLAIFDLDGTLCDTLADIYASLDYVFNKNSLISPSLEEAKTLMGDGLKAFMEKAAKLNNVKDCTAVVSDEFVDHYSENCTRKTTVYDGILKLLDDLDNRNIKLAVLSNKSEFLVKVILQHFNLNHRFLAVSGGDTFAEKKPSPLPVQETLSMLGFSKNEAIMIGDSENDVASGYGAGVATCHCAYGYGVGLKTKPSFSASSPEEIIKIFMDKL